MNRREFATLIAGLPAMAYAGSKLPEVRRPDLPVATAPALSAEAMGWLAHLDRKVGLGGTWTKNDQVGPQWDTKSFVPTMYFPRYELTWLSWSMGLMAETTPAWREEYAKILGFLGDRFLEYWSFAEWVENRGDDPARSSYPEAMKAAIPEGQWGRYNLPGWAGNGSRTEPYDPDPIRAGGRFGLMYKGYLNLVLSMYSYVSDDGKYSRPFVIRYDDHLSWTYDQRRLNEILAQQWQSHEEGIACEVTKVYPWCNTLAGSSVKLYDALHGTRFADPYKRFQKYFAQHYVGSDRGQGPDWMMGYYDADLKTGVADHGRQNGSNWVPVIWHGLAMDEAQFRPLYESLFRLLYRPQKDGSAHLAVMGGTDADLSITTGLGAALAREMGDTDRADAMRRWIDRHYEPTRDNTRGEFAFGFGLGEEWPRGQYNAWVMPALLGTRAGQWRGIFQRPNVAKFSQPTVEGIDFPAVRVRVAAYDAKTRTLHVELAAATPAVEGKPTHFRITRLPRGSRWAVANNGAPPVEHRAADGSIEVATTIGSQRFEVRALA